MKHASSSANVVSAVYDYFDEDKVLLYQVVRFADKTFRDRRPDANGGWNWNLEGVRLVLYRLPEVEKAESVLVLEGEKDVDTAYKLGLPSCFAATTSPLGAGQWRSQYAESLRGKRVLICPDNDIPGKKHMKQIVRDLSCKASEILLLSLPDRVKDLSEWVEAGARVKQFHELINMATSVVYDQL